MYDFIFVCPLLDTIQEKNMTHLKLWRNNNVRN
jgi:hypothetical protein